ncbi:PREDICTED: E3 SUMO-protein ligase NSE2-like isoform X1 [Papilio xuthus]|uniref:E3 SUMO-protein ligase NSE2 n=1 Tax=Papilio xuthus TaxID=66420 RepID=A0AAJ6ZLB1_PAPXU|nr:PREDICTED: E3 SUMO-protein ligase NSE2-like isoform X1 [Papilio xuthus]
MVDAELSDLRKQCVASLYSCAENVGLFLDGQEMETEFLKLKSCIDEYCTMEARQDVANQALEKAKNEIESNIEPLQDRFEFHLSSMAQRDTDNNQHPYMIELNKKVEMGCQRATQNLDDSDLAITETQDRYIDPITKRPVTDPVQNSVCGHIYDRGSIMKLINTRKKVICPVAGCGSRQPLRAHQLAPAPPAPHHHHH